MARRLLLILGGRDPEVGSRALVIMADVLPTNRMFTRNSQLVDRIVLPEELGHVAELLRRKQATTRLPGE